MRSPLWTRSRQQRRSYARTMSRPDAVASHDCGPLRAQAISFAEDIAQPPLMLFVDRDDARKEVHGSWIIVIVGNAYGLAHFLDENQHVSVTVHGTAEEPGVSQPRRSTRPLFSLRCCRSDAEVDRRTLLMHVFVDRLRPEQMLRCTTVRWPRSRIAS
jgi:hypothetical protein